MESKASINGHPLHPILVAFPVAFFFGAVVADIAAFTTLDSSWAYFAGWLAIAGVVTAAVAAVPGLIDYLFAIPKKSHQKRIATYHMIVNLVGTGSFLLAWLLRDAARVPALEVVLLEVFGVLFISLGGWLGGSLVYRHRVGVETAYN